MSRGRLKRLWKNHQHEPDCQAVGADWLAFWKNLQAIRRQGYWTSTGELDAGLAGIAAPILFGTGEVAGSMSLVFALDEFRNYDAELLGSRLRGAASQLSRTLAELRRSPSPPPAAPAGDAGPKPPSRGGRRLTRTSPAAAKKPRPRTHAAKPPAAARRRSGT